MRLDLSGIGPLSPGSVARVPIRFLCPHLIVPRLSVGSPFTLWEGGTIGEGTVIEISPSPLPNGAFQPTAFGRHRTWMVGHFHACLDFRVGFIFPA